MDTVVKALGATALTVLCFWTVCFAAAHYVRRAGLLTQPEHLRPVHAGVNPRPCERSPSGSTASVVELESRAFELSTLWPALQSSAPSSTL